MRTLTLMRHAKSSWNDPSLSDHDRPLNARGKRAAETMACRMRDGGYRPDLVISSSAERARETVGYFRKCFADVMVDVDGRLYDADVSVYPEIVRSLDASVRHLMIVAHNPVLETVAALLGEPDTVLPTAAYVRFAVPEKWEAFCLTPHRRLAYDFPKSSR